MMSEALAKIKKYGPCTFFLTYSVAEFNWVDIVQIVASQYCEQLSADQIQNLS